MLSSFKGNALHTDTPMPTAAELDGSSGMRLSDTNKHPRDHAIARTNAGSGPATRKEIDKQSLDYVLRSGLAGGLAGCAVWFPIMNRRTTIIDSALMTLTMIAYLSVSKC